MDENHQDKTETKGTTTEDKSIPSSLSPQDQRGTEQLRKNQMEETVKQLRDRGYTVTEEYSNTGQLTKVSAEHPQRKTWWDWLQLLIIPLVLALVTFGLGLEQTRINDTNNALQQMRAQTATAQQRMTDQQLAADQQQEATLKAYLDDMTTLLLDKKLGSQAVADKVASAEAAVIARAKTLIVLRRLTDPRRKATVVQFLYEAHLIGYPSCITCPVAPAVIDLSFANLSGADLNQAGLEGANLSLADLSGATLSFAHLVDADLYHATLSVAHLSGADLYGADLSSADLSLADLSGAHLRGAHLIGADLSFAHLIDADLSGATLRGAHLRGAHLRGAHLSLALQLHLCGGNLP